MGVCVSGPCILVQLDKQAVADDASLHLLDARMPSLVILYEYMTWFISHRNWREIELSAPSPCPVDELLRAKDTLHFCLLPGLKGAHGPGKLAMFISHMLLGELQYLPLPPRGFLGSRKLGGLVKGALAPRSEGPGHGPHH